MLLTNDLFQLNLLCTNCKDNAGILKIAERKIHPLCLFLLQSYAQIKNSKDFRQLQIFIGDFLDINYRLP